MIYGPNLFMEKLYNLSLSFEDALLSLDRLKANNILHDAVKEAPLFTALETLIVPALERIGVDWEQGIRSLSQVYMSGRICEELIDEILPPAGMVKKKCPKMAISVLDDHHMLGKRIVYSLLRTTGYDLIDYGRLDSKEMIARTIDEGIQILLISTLMLSASLKIKEVKKGLKFYSRDVKIIVGGAPFRYDSRLGSEVGADFTAKTASDAFNFIQQIMNTDKGPQTK